MYRNYPQKPSLLYNLVDDPNVKRTLTFRKLVMSKLTNGSEESVLLWRLAIVLAEQVFMSWLGAFAVAAVKSPAKQQLIALRPWKLSDYSYRGTNSQCPIRENIRRPEGTSPITEEEQRDRAAGKMRLRRAHFTDEQKAETKIDNADYRQRVAIPVERMKRAGASAAEIEAFRRQARLEQKELKRMLSGEKPDRRPKKKASSVLPEPSPAEISAHDDKENQRPVLVNPASRGPSIAQVLGKRKAS